MAKQVVGIEAGMESFLLYGLARNGNGCCSGSLPVRQIFMMIAGGIPCRPVRPFHLAL